MKKLSLLITILCLLTGISEAATLSGTITNGATLAPVPNYRVYVRDSFNVYRDSALTGYNGTYSITLPATVLGGRIIVSVLTCGTQTKALTYSGSSVTASFSVCATAPLYNLYGTVSLAGATNFGVAKLYLIRMQYDSTTLDTTLTAIDSFTTASSGGTFSKTYTSQPYVYGTLLLKAALVPSHPSYGSYFPTYYGGALVWSTAATINVGHFTGNSANISMIAGTNPGGPGFVGGSVLVGANKQNAVGDPLAGRILLLTNGSGQAVTFTYSDTAGKFSFPSLAYGTYKIFGDAWGKSNPALTFTLTSAKKGISNIVFEENDTTFRGHLIPLGVTPVALSGVGVYPNPVGDRASFTGVDHVAGEKSVVLRDVTGAVLLRQSFSNGQPISVSTGTLPPGIYLLQLQTEAGAASFKVIK